MCSGIPRNLQTRKIMCFCGDDIVVDARCSLCRRTAWFSVFTLAVLGAGTFLQVWWSASSAVWWDESLDFYWGALFGSHELDIRGVLTVLVQTRLLKSMFKAKKIV